MKNAHGFTLMEVLVALALLSVFTVVSYRALNTVLDARRLARDEMEHWRAVAAVFARMESDLSNAVRGLDARDASGDVFLSQLGADGTSQFEMVRLLPEDADDGVARVGYRCAEGKLTQLVWPQVAGAVGAFKESLLLQGLRACSFRFLDNQAEWRPAWTSRPVQPLPRAVALDLVQGDGTALRRVWRVQ